MTENLHFLPVEQKVGQLFFIGLPGAELDAATCQLLEKITPGGVCLFARNIRERRATRELLDGIRTTLAVSPFLSIDQEGGLVDRLRRIIDPTPAAQSIRCVEDASRLGGLIADTLRILGFNMNFAPVVDVVISQRTKFTNGLFSRTFSDSREGVTAFAGEFLRSLQANGIIGCAKHFPGLGAASVDSHEELPQVEVSEAEFMSTDLFPYRELIRRGDVVAIMAAHASYQNVNLQERDQNGKLLPSSLSYNYITTLLRDALAFDGLVITDDLEMGAIIKNYGIGDACTMAIKAGVDMLAICADPEAVRTGHAAVLHAVTAGDISMSRLDESLSRIATVRSKLSEPLDFDIQRLQSLSDEIAQFDQRSGRV